MRVFVTGGTGFIGAYVVKALSDAGHRTSVLRRNADKARGLGCLKGVTFIEGDLADTRTIRGALEGHSACIHIALHPGDTAREMLLGDTLSSVRLFEMAAGAGVGAIIYTSSTAANDWVYMDDAARRKGEAVSVNETTKPRPVTYYGATKGASELYLNAIAYQRNLRANVIRPGYTFGNPVVEGATCQSDTRFEEIAKKAMTGAPIELIRNDGTQFIWAGDLARVYLAVLESQVRDRMFFGLGATFITWEEVAEEAIALAGSKSRLVMKDLGWPKRPALFDVSAIEAEFGFRFECRERIAEHLAYYMKR